MVGNGVDFIAVFTPVSFAKFSLIASFQKACSEKSRHAFPTSSGCKFVFPCSYLVAAPGSQAGTNADVKESLWKQEDFVAWQGCARDHFASPDHHRCKGYQGKHLFWLWISPRSSPWLKRQLVGKLQKCSLECSLECSSWNVCPKLFHSFLGVLFYLDYLVVGGSEHMRGVVFHHKSPS